jgi:SAM-dependent methyltransferase
VFGVIFAPDAERAFAETLRVLRPGGRALLGVWVPEGAIDAMVGVIARAIGEASGAARTRFAWHDPATVGALAARHGAARVTFEEGEVSFAAESPESYYADGEANHPMSVASRPLLERAGSCEAVREQALAILRAGNEDPDRFRVTSRYRVIRVERSA